MKTKNKQGGKRPGSGAKKKPYKTKVSIVVDSFGIVAYYPKSNRLLIQKDNKWVNDGLNWIIENLL